METMHAAGRRRLPPVPRPDSTRAAGRQLTVENPAVAAQTPAEQTTAEQASEPTADEVTAERTTAEQVTAEQIDTGETAAERTEAVAGTDSPAEATTDDGAAAEEPGTDAATADEDTGDTRQPPLPDIPAEIAATGTAEDDGGDAEPVVTDAAVVPAPRQEQQIENVVDEQDPAQQFVIRLRTSAADFAGAAGAESAVVREAVPPARHRRARCRLVLRYGDGDVADVTLLGPAGSPGRPSRHGFDRQILRWLGAGLVREHAWLVDDPDAPDGVAVDLTAWVATG